MPWLVIQTSATKRRTANTMSAIPAAFASRVPKAKSARTMQMTPTTPGKMRLGFDSSKMIPYVPSVKSSTAICGSVMRWRKTSSGLRGSSSTGAPLVRRTTDACGSATSRPWIWSRSARTSCAT
jgi:hypothetical protein